jgi:hypothetical protein
MSPERFESTLMSVVGLAGHVYHQADGRQLKIGALPPGMQAGDPVQYILIEVPSRLGGTQVEATCTGRPSK